MMGHIILIYREICPNEERMNFRLAFCHLQRSRFPLPQDSNLPSVYVTKFNFQINTSRGAQVGTSTFAVQFRDFCQLK